MPKKYQLRTESLQFLSSGSKIGVQILWLTSLVILPQFFPQIIELHYKTSLTINILLALITSIAYEIIKFIYKKKDRNYQWLVNLQLLTSVILLSWFLHVFGRINGPFFILYLLTIMESSLNLNVHFPNIVVAIAVFFTVTEFTFLVLIKEIALNLYVLLQLLIRLTSLFFMRSYGFYLASKIISEARSRNRFRQTAIRLEEVTQKLKKTNQSLKEVSALKDEFVSLTSHELRTPLTAVVSSLATVLEGFAGRVPGKAKEFLAGAHNEASRLIRLVNNLLNISRIEAGRLKFNPTAFDLAAIVESSLEGLVSQAKEKKLDFTYFAPGLQLKADEDKVREILINLAGNAIKFTESGSVKITVSRQGNFVLIVVEDTGRGIRAEDQNKLFRKFERVEGVKAVERKGGTGLGLYICKNLVEGMGGEIWFTSEHGKGTTFFFTLPIS